jgi:tRNA U34 5-methylaminomethyl-2-thiouridine-forming methyltransferase MnmC
VKDAGCEVVLTRSGARAMLDHASGEVMHPIGGPLAEAARLYVGPSQLEQRLREATSEPLVLLDVGLGAGTLAAAALRVRLGLPAGMRRLEVVSFERNLSALRLALRPEHESAFGWDGPAGEAARALASTGCHDSPTVGWTLRHGDILEQLAREPAASADLAFWDPFSPEANPELWTLAAFRALRRVCRNRASVHTYSGATRVRSALLLAGFAVGIGDKIADGKYATIAALSGAGLAPSVLAQPLDRRWLERLSRSSAPFPSDAPPTAFEQVRGLPQFAPELGEPASGQSSQ